MINKVGKGSLKKTEIGKFQVGNVRKVGKSEVGKFGLKLESTTEVRKYRIIE